MASSALAAAKASITKQPDAPKSITTVPAPMSTSKALLILIVVPRIHRVYVAEPEPPDPPEPTTAESSVVEDVVDDGNDENLTEKSEEESNAEDSGSSRNDQDRERELEDTEHSNATTTSAVDDDIVGYVTGECEDEPVEHVVTAEEMAAVVKIPPTKPDAAESVKDEQDKEEKLAQDAKTDMASRFSKTFFGIMNRDREDSVAKLLDEEEAKQVITRDDSILPQDEAPNTEINVEELLRLTFKTLLSEGHLLNAPIYTAIKSSSKRDGDEWIELSVMVKAQSIGITLERLERIGVGSNVGTVSIYKAELCRTAYHSPAREEEATPARSRANSETQLMEKQPASNNNNGNNNKSETGVADNKVAIEAARAEWMNAASRLRVEQVKEQIAEQASFSFDFLALLSIASILAGIGLIVDNTVVIVASMLVSPIMGPVMGMTFGSRVRDWDLTKKSAIVECLALLLSVGIGAAIGLCSAWTDVAESWPTNEMSIRGDTKGLLTGIAIAIPSGMGVALAILGNNTASLVGVAISASLLPPAVNAGVCWMFAILLRTGAVERRNDEDFAYIGGISFALTVINIVCIWISGMLMFAIKEVAPTKSKSAFWSRDIKVARTVNVGSTRNEVDVEVLRAGLESALEKENGQKTKRPDTNRWRKPRASPPPNITFNLAVNPVPIDGIGQTGNKHAKKIGLDKLVRSPSVQQGERQLSNRDAEEGPEPETDEMSDDVQYYGLDDMAALLGFDEEDEYLSEEELVSQEKTGWGWGWFK